MLCTLTGNRNWAWTFENKSLLSCFFMMMHSTAVLSVLKQPKQSVLPRQFKVLSLLNITLHCNTSPVPPKAVAICRLFPVFEQFPNPLVYSNEYYIISGPNIVLQEQCHKSGVFSVSVWSQVIDGCADPLASCMFVFSKLTLVLLEYFI